MLLLKDRKTSRRKKLSGEKVAFNDPMLVRLAIMLCTGKSPGSFLYEGTAPLFRAELKSLLAFFEITDPDYQAYSLRRGGASWYFQVCKSIDAVMVKGRWNHDTTARIYIESAAEMFNNSSLSDRSSELLRELAPFIKLM